MITKLAMKAIEPPRKDVHSVGLKYQNNFYIVLVGLPKRSKLTLSFFFNLVLKFIAISYILIEPHFLILYPGDFIYASLKQFCSSWFWGNGR